MAAYAALVSVMHIIDNLKLHPHPPISLHNKQVESLTKTVTFLQEFLEGYNPNLGYGAEADPLESRIADAAYEAEHAIESHIVDRIRNDGENMSSEALYEALEKVIEKLESIQRDAMKIKENVGFHHQPTPPDSLRSSSTVQKISMVGADDLLLEMKEKLICFRRDLQVIPIVGMGGSGKTTLAVNIYQDRFIKEHFSICAWATISQEYSIREMLKEVLCKLNQGVSKNMSESQLGDKLHKHLFGRRYLIIMDDMWSIEAWDGFKRFLPDNENGSRIVVTTRLSNLASIISNSDSTKMKLLGEADSWDLLSKTVFGGEGRCPLELEKIGKKIANGCKGLPLSIAVVGGILAKSRHTREFWERVEENISSIVSSGDDQSCMKILYMSYKQLPVHLKPCFLYMGVFREDARIEITNLIILWVAEGFLKPVSGKSLEEIAFKYLEDLGGRNLLLIDKLGGLENIESFKIHDLLRELCLKEAKKEGFYAVVARSPNPQEITNGQRRILISSSISRNEAITALSSAPLLRSLIWNSDNDPPPLNSNSRLLRIFNPHPRQRQDADFLENVHQFVNLRFLHLWPRSKFNLCCSIRLFWNLQTLMGFSFDGFTVVNIWYMPHLRHVGLFGTFHLPDPPNGQDDIVLGNLQSLEKVQNLKLSKQVVERIPNIRNLEIVFSKKLDVSNLGHLEKLESLICYSYFGYIGMNQINFPHSLKNLTLDISSSEFWEDILDKIGVLPLLQKLTLRGGTFKHGRWETTEGRFCSLKFLALDRCEGLQVWTMESSHFPCLESLCLRDLKELEMIPSEFADISTLKTIEVIRCSDSAVESAKRILEEQEDLYGEEGALQVRVTLSSWSRPGPESLKSPNYQVSFEWN